MSSFNALTAENRIEKLENIVNQFKQNYNIELYFCDIIGKRWSFIAGEAHSYLPQKRVVINETLGMVIDDSAVTEKDLDNVIDIIKSKIFN